MERRFRWVSLWLADGPLKGTEFMGDFDYVQTRSRQTSTSTPTSTITITGLEPVGSSKVNRQIEMFGARNRNPTRWRAHARPFRFSASLLLDQISPRN